MSSLLCFGLGYTAEHYLTAYGDRFDRIIGTVRDRNRAEELTRAYAPWGTVFEFDDNIAHEQIQVVAAAADFALITAPPGTSGDPVIEKFGSVLAQNPALQSVVYLSTIGVYGDHGGQWVDEDSHCRPTTERNRQRLNAERAWQAFSTGCRVPLATLRLSGIYGPGRNAFVKLRAGGAKNIVKPGQAFNRVHVADIAQAIDAAFAHRASGIFNVTDDEPSSASAPVAFAAQLLQIEPPAEISFGEAQASMSPMARSFYTESKRARNDKLKSKLGVTLRYPTYREGLSALHRESHHAEG